MAGRKNFIMKAVSLFMNMDKMLGREFEKGLANLNAAVEAKKTGTQGSVASLTSI